MATEYYPRIEPAPPPPNLDDQRARYVAVLLTLLERTLSNGAAGEDLMDRIERVLK